MSEKDKSTVVRLAEIFDDLPDEKKQYFDGYADGVADMKQKKEVTQNAERA